MLVSSVDKKIEKTVKTKEKETCNRDHYFLLTIKRRGKLIRRRIKNKRKRRIVKDD